MKKLLWLPILLLGLLNFSCKSKKKIKTETQIEYKTKNYLGNLVKDTIDISYTLGFDINGKETYFLGLKGYGNSDTNFRNKHEDSFYTKKNGDTIFSYFGSKLNSISLKKGDTTFEYDETGNFLTGF